MKLFVSIIVAFLAAGCGANGGNENPAVPAAADEPAPVAAPAAPAAPESAPAEAAGSQDPAPALAEAVVGTWENSSCGDREYLRRIVFSKNGTFAAVDAVSPCPPGAMCVWSGIINWHGTYAIQGDVIAIKGEPLTGERQPESLPSEFVVVARSPLSIGERQASLVCPYKRR